MMGWPIHIILFTPFLNYLHVGEFISNIIIIIYAVNLIIFR